MKKTAKFLLAGIGSLILLFAIGAAVFLASFDANRYKSEIEAEAKAATGRELTIGGDIDVAFFPWLAIEANDLTLSNRAGFGDAPFLKLRKATARVKLEPLFSRRVEIGEVRIEGLALALARQADGTDNWSDIGQKEAGADEAPTAGEAFGVSVEGVRIIDGALTLADAQAGTTLEVKDLDLSTGPVAPGQPLSFKGGLEVERGTLAAKLAVSGRAAADFASVEDLTLKIDATGAPLPAPIADGKLSIAKLTLGEPLQVDGFAFEAWGLALAGTVTVTGDETKGSFKSAPFAPRKLLRTLGVDVPVTADPKALDSAQFEFKLVQRGDMMRLDGLTIGIDASKLTGHVAVDSIERNAVRFDLALDGMDLDRYLSPVTQKADIKLGGFEAVKVPVELLRGHDVDGEFAAGKLSVNKAHLTDLKVALSIRDGALDVHSLSAKLYGGRVTAKGALDGRPAVPKAAFKLDLKDFKVGDFMQDVVGKTYASGVAALSFDLAGDGATLGEIKHDLDGPIRFDIQQGTLEGFNVWKEARIAYAKYKKRETTAVSDPDRTEFEKLAGGADLKAGVATLVGVTAAIPYAAVTAKGTVDLTKNLLHIEANAKITGAPVFGPKEDYSDLKGATLPVKISGKFVDPSVSVDVVKAVISTLKPDNEKIKKKLKGIFG